MDTRNFAATQKSGAGHDKGATNINPPSTGAQGQREGGNHPVFTPSYHTAMTTDGFKNDNVGDETTHNITTPTPVADGSQPLGQQQQKGSKLADWTQGDEAQKQQQQQQGNKLRGVFGRLKKGTDATGDETTEGQGEVGGDAKQKDGGVVE